MQSSSKSDNGVQEKKKRPSVDDLMRRIKWPFNRFYLFLVIAIIFATGLGLVSYKVYLVSDAASLDLSRPGFQKVRDEVSASKEEPILSSTGEVGQGFIHEVIDALDYYRNRVGSSTPFAPEPLLDDNLINVN